MKVSQISASVFTYPAGHPEGPGRGELFLYAIAIDGETTLVDTGIGSDEPWINEHYRPSPFDLLASLRAAGIEPSSVKAVICSHLHFDHCGNNRLFPAVPIYVQRAEYAAAKGKDYTVPEWLDFPGANYQLLDGSARLNDRIEICFTPGHTPGHQSVLVAGDEGLECIVAQAAYSASEFDAYANDGDPAVRNDCWSGAAYAESLRMLHDRNPRLAYFSHDRTIWCRKG